MTHFHVARLLVTWVIDRPSRLVLLGYRPEVICLIKNTAYPRCHLLIRSQAHRNHWAPPQEGMKIHESIESTVHRCLLHELGIGPTRIQYRKSVWLGTRTLPKDRWDERVLKYSLRGLFGKASMIGKGYYAALVIADSDTTIDPNPAEVYEWAWVQSADFQALVATNPPDKLKLLQLAWSLLEEPRSLHNSE